MTTNEEHEQAEREAQDKAWTEYYKKVSALMSEPRMTVAEAKEAWLYPERDDYLRKEYDDHLDRHPYDNQAGDYEMLSVVWSLLREESTVELRPAVGRPLMKLSYYLSCVCDYLEDWAWRLKKEEE